MKLRHILMVLVPGFAVLVLSVLAVALGASLYVAPEVSVQVVPQQDLISAAYKAYGNPATGMYVAKAVVQNDSKLPIYDFEISYRLEGFTEWSPPSRYSEVVPGQTVLDVYFPVLSSEITSDSSARRANLHSRWQYRRPNGKLVQEAYSASLSVLGVNALTWTSLPDEEILSWMDAFNNYLLIAAFITPNEETAKTFAVNATKGLNTQTSDQDAEIAFARAFYSLREWGVGYFQEPLDAWAARFTQYVQFPHDTIRRKGGTCIDLAIVLSTMMEAVGIKSYVILGPGHAIPAIELGNGRIIPVESTFIDRDYAYRNFANVVSQRVTFEESSAVAAQQVNEWMQDGRYLFMSPQEAWRLGVMPPW